MPVVEGREYRSFSFEPVASETDSYVVEGYATTFDDPYEMWDGWREAVARTALDNADMSDVIFQLNHEGTVMARLRNGSMTLTIDAHGLHVRAYLGGSQAGRDLFEAIKSGLIDRMSWGFSVSSNGWEIDEETRTATIVEVDKVYDVSAVSIPANEGTEIHARSYLDGVIEVERRESAAREQETRERALLAALLDIL